MPARLLALQTTLLALAVGTGAYARAAASPAAGAPALPNGSEGGSASPDRRPGVVTGTAVDALGRPLAGVTISAENTIISHSFVSGVTDARGHYTLDLSGLTTSWHVRAYFTRAYNGTSYQFDLHPDNDAAFASGDGAVRNFDWRLTGERPNSGGRQFYGGRVNFYLDVFHFPEGATSKDVEFTFVPAGPLVDGTPGKTLTLRAPQGGVTVEDVPLGTYRIGARLVRAGQAARPLQVRLTKGAADFADAVTGSWPKEKYLSVVGPLELDVRDRASGVYPSGAN